MWQWDCGGGHSICPLTLCQKIKKQTQTLQSLAFNQNSNHWNVGFIARLLNWIASSLKCFCVHPFCIKTQCMGSFQLCLEIWFRASLPGCDPSKCEKVSISEHECFVLLFSLKLLLTPFPLWRSWCERVCLRVCCTLRCLCWHLCNISFPSSFLRHASIIADCFLCWFGLILCNLLDLCSLLGIWTLETMVLSNTAPSEQSSALSFNTLDQRLLSLIFSCLMWLNFLHRGVVPSVTVLDHTQTQCCIDCTITWITHTCCAVCRWLFTEVGLLKYNHKGP